MNIEMLFPEICCLYGDLANVTYLERCVPDSHVISTSLKAEPAFLSEPVDLITMGSMTESAQELAALALMPHKEKIRELIDSGTVFLITGNALEIFGNHIEKEDGATIEGLGIFDLCAKRQMMKRYNALYLGRFGDMEIVGFKSQFSHSYGDSRSFCLFETLRGDGLSPGVKWEGVKINNFIATYVLGPLVVLNPPFARYLLKLMGVKNPQLAFEEAVLESYNLRLQEFKDPKTGVRY